MDKRIKKAELLAPAGSFEAMKASVNAGADAVYMGGEMFGARAYAKNPDSDGILQAMDFCHLRGRKFYLTVNTLLKDIELRDKLYDYLLPFYNNGLDAVIVQDIGVMDFIGENFPGLNIHVSTQCSLTMAYGLDGVRSYLSHPQSITRIVPARELGIEELKILRRDTDVELEVFVHGAICYSYSGQCLFSSFAGGRSGNRGRCAQPCRKLYTVDITEQDTGGYFLSPKDMCTLEQLTQLLDIGIDSFKIEGRMKSPEYAAGVVAAYRRIIDGYYVNKGHDFSSETNTGDVFGIDELKELYNRGGFVSSYLFNRNGQDMMSTVRPGHFGVLTGEVLRTEGRKAFIKATEDLGQGDVLELRAHDGRMVYEFTLGKNMSKGEILDVLTMKDRLPQKGMQVYRTRNEKLLERIDSSFLEKDIRIKTDLKVNCRLGEPLSVKYSAFSGAFGSSVCVEIAGNTVQKAIKSKVSYEDIRSRLTKLGNTDFYAGNVEITGDEDIFIPIGELNSIRREAVLSLKEKILSKYQRSGLSGRPNIRETLPFEKTAGVSGIFTAYVSDISQLEWIEAYDKERILSEIYFEEEEERVLDKAVSICEQSGRRLWISLPRIARSWNLDKIKDICKNYLHKVSGFIARNYEEVAILNELGAGYRTDSNLYVFNSIGRYRHEKMRENGGFEAGYTLSMELNRNETEAVSGPGAELIVYGLMPVMVSAQCIYKTVTGKCSPHGPIRLTDEKKFTFTDTADCKNCTNTIYNSSVLNLLAKLEELREFGCGRFGLRFTLEKEEEMRLVIRCLSTVLNGDKYIFPEEIMGLKMTNGHLFRGVE